MNLLAGETSPYLLQHADNPVHWRPWGPAALAEAKASNRPILLSVGYAACHWCHVMAHESFEDAETAALMNALYVNIKVDREERPDIDHLYMSALHATGEQGGWPLTMFLTPDAEPFWGGTYFPPTPRWGRPSFRQVLEGVANTFHADPAGIAKNVATLGRALAAVAAERPGDPPGPATLDRAAAHLLRLVDHDQGGLRGAPKFPNPPIFAFLWQDSFRTGTQDGRAATHHLLRAMSQGGIYDHLGGAYARYSTDAEWLVPHFEKMLYDNAQILDLLALAHADAPDPLYAQRAAETVLWLTRDMRAESAQGHTAFAASEDADSEGVEGKFYVWTEAEIDRLLGPDAPAFKIAYDVTPDGNWEHTTILRRVTPPGDALAETRLALSRETLLAARDHRIRPGRDDKVLADWNALTITALARAAAVFEKPEWLALAEDAFAFLIAAMSTSDGRVAHAWRLGRVTAAGLLDDQATLAQAALALFESTGAPYYLARAKSLAAAADTWFGDDTSGSGGASYFTSASDAEDVPLARPRTPGDNATPAGNGIMALVLARLHHLTGDPAYRTRCESVLRAFGGLGDSWPAAPSLLRAADLLEEAATVVITGPDADRLRAITLAAPDPAVILLRTPPADHPAAGKASDRAAAFVCRAGVCSLPVNDPEELKGLLSKRK